MKTQSFLNRKQRIFIFSIDILKYSILHQFDQARVENFGFQIDKTLILINFLE